VTSSDRENLISSETTEKIDSVLREWSQGDCTIGDYYFVTRFDPLRPLTEGSQNLVATGIETDLIESLVMGFVVVTQTCDIVSSCAKRHFLDVSPLILVTDKELAAIKKRSNSSKCAYIAGVADSNLVADLDRVMTVEKAVVLAWERRQGCQNDTDIRHFGEALARKCSRFAFPDDFNDCVKEMQKQMIKKHDKYSPEGDALRALREIRVRASPDWNRNKVEVLFYFIRDEENNLLTDEQWNEWKNNWLNSIDKSGRFNWDGIVIFLEEMNAKEYVESDRLDLDYLSR
jgi:hypothetical protein